jgi:glucose-1-phosphate cytidylyltransferase
MKIFILCGGFGSRLDYEGKLKAKPMIRIGNKPILMHLIETFVRQGFDDFVFCLGHKSETIINYFISQKKNVKIIFKDKKNLKILFNSKGIKFNGDFIYTGIDVGTGRRVALAYKKLQIEEDFLVTYGDGLANINFKKLIKFHHSKNSLATITAVRPKNSYGILKFDAKSFEVTSFDDSKKKSDVYINGGYFIFSKRIIDKIKDNNIYFEKEPLRSIIKKKKLYAFMHNGFWKSLDTLKDKNDFNKIIKSGKKPWLN